MIHWIHWMASPFLPMRSTSHHLRPSPSLHTFSACFEPANRGRCGSTVTAVGTASKDTLSQEDLLELSKVSRSRRAALAQLNAWEEHSWLRRLLECLEVVDLPLGQAPDPRTAGATMPKMNLWNRSSLPLGVLVPAARAFTHRIARTQFRVRADKNFSRLNKLCWCFRSACKKHPRSAVGGMGSR